MPLQRGEHRSRETSGLILAQGTSVGVVRGLDLHLKGVQGLKLCFCKGESTEAGRPVVSFWLKVHVWVMFEV